MKKVRPDWLGVDVISFPKLLGLKYHQSSYGVASIAYAEIPSSAISAAIALPDSQVLQKTLPSMQSLNEYSDQYALDFRSVDEQILMTATSKATLQSILDRFPTFQVTIVDTESSCVQRCLQKLFLIESAAYIILLVDQTECRFYALQQSKLIFKYREHLSEDVAVSVRRCWQIFTTTITSLSLQQFYLAGDHQGLNSIFEIVQQITPIPVSIINPFERLSFISPLEKTAWLTRGPAFVVACGLALRGLSNE